MGWSLRVPALASLGGGDAVLRWENAACSVCRERPMCRSAFSFYPRLFFLSKTDVNCTSHAPNSLLCHLRARHLRCPVEPRRGTSRRDLRGVEASQSPLSKTGKNTTTSPPCHRRPQGPLTKRQVWSPHSFPQMLFFGLVVFFRRTKRESSARPLKGMSG